MLPAPDHRLSRRTTLRGVVLASVAFTLTGCSGRIHLPGGGSGTAAPAQTPAEQLADVVLANRLVGELGVGIASLRATLSAHPALEPQLRPLLAAQRQQRRVLRLAIPAQDRTAFTPTRPDVPTKAKAALAKATLGVSAQRDAFRAAARTAESGELARVLASAAAGISQHLARLGKSW